MPSCGTQTITETRDLGQPQFENNITSNIFEAVLKLWHQHPRDERHYRIKNTLELFPKHVQILQTKFEDQLASITKDLVEVLKYPHHLILFLDQG